MVEFSGDDAGRGGRPRREAAAAAERRHRRRRRWCRPWTRRCAIRSGTCAAPRCRCCTACPATASRSPSSRTRGGAGAAAGVRGPLPRPAAAPRHRRRLLRPRQRRLPAHSPAAQSQGPRRRGPDAAHHRGRDRPGAGVRRLASAASTATAWRAASGTARCSARSSTRPSARSSSCSTRTDLLNPGKVVDAAPMTENLRYGPDYHPVEPATVFDYSKQEGFVRAVEMCNGNGACRKLARRDDVPVVPGHPRREGQHARPGQRPAAGAGRRRSRCEELRSRWVHDVLDLCLMCKACKAECPSNVDMAKLKAEFLELYYRGPAAAAGPAADGPHPSAQPAGAPVGAAGELAADAAAAALAAGEDGRHRPPPQSAAAARRSLPPLVRPASPAPTRDGCGTGAAAGRLLHDVQRAGHRPGRGARAGSGRLRASSWPA